VPADFMGGRLELSYGEAQFEVDGAAFEGIEGENKSGRIGLSRPFLRTRSDRLLASAGISSTESNADLFGNTFSDTQITLLELAATYAHTYTNLAVTQLSAAIATNFEEATLAELFEPGVQDDQRLRLEIDAQHLQPIPGKTLQLLLRANGVYSPDPLADTQQFSIGGPSSVRGYAASEARGDRGYFGSITLRQPFAWGPANFAGRVFADAGKVFLADRDPGADDQSTLSSVGVGVDASYARLSAKLDWSFARDQQVVEDAEDDRLFGTVSVTF
jgi:hemolysin activation/secretion protein